MKNQLIIIIILILALLVPITSAAEPNSKLIRELSLIDSFHPDISDDYEEWHYFNIIDEERDLKFFVTFKIHDDPIQSYASIIMFYNIVDDFGGVNESYLIDNNVEYSGESPDLKISDNYVKLLPNGYKVYAKGIDNEDNEIIFDVTYIPMGEPTSVFSGPFGDSDTTMNWVSAAPACKVNGNLIIDGVDFPLKGVRGYHDHNWGEWSWGNNIGWDWGQAIQANNENGNTVGRYCIVLGRLTDSFHERESGNRLLLWKNKHQIAVFNHVDFEYEMTELYPSKITATATAEDNGNSITSTFFRTSNAIPLPLYEPGNAIPTIIWELTGN